MDFFPFPGNQTRCVGVQIIDDLLFRCNRTFNLTLSCGDYFVRSSPYPTSVLIIEDEPEGQCRIILCLLLLYSYRGPYSCSITFVHNFIRGKYGQTSCIQLVYL